MAVGTKNCAFLMPVQQVDLQFLTKKKLREKVVLDFHVLQAFDTKTRWTYGISMIFTIFMWNILNIFKAKLTESKENFGVIHLAVLVISIQSLVSIPTRNLSSLHHRIFLAVLFVFALIKCNAFQGSVVSRLTSPPKSNDINTLDELLETNSKLLSIIAIPDLFKPNHDESNVNEVQKRIYGRLKTVEFDPRKIAQLTEKDAYLRNNNSTIYFLSNLFYFFSFQSENFLRLKSSQTSTINQLAKT